MKTEIKTTNAASFKMIALADIAIGKTNPRKDFDQETSQELIDSVREKGVLQPVIVRKKGNAFELVCGERRYRSAKAVQIAHKDRTTIPAMIRELSDDEVLELQIIENLQRKDVHPMEEAAAFKQLIESKKYSIQEIAKRVGKSDNYVAGRIKLNDLIPEFQKVFYKNEMGLISAMKLIRISKDDQKDLWDEDFKDNQNDEIEISDYEIHKYQGDLLKAPFDTKDPSIVKAVGACGGCQHNTASNTLLFPEAASSAKCMNSKCFKTKTDLFFVKELKTVLEDPAVILLSDEYSPGKKTKELIAKGYKVYAKSNVEVIDLPDPVDEEDVTEYCDNAAEKKQALKEAYEDYQKDLDKYNKLTASGKLVKAFVVEGNAQGRYVHVKLQKDAKSATGSSKDTQAKIKEGAASETDIKAEIERIKTNATRKEEIETEKITCEYYKVLQDNELKFIINTPLKPIEMAALIIVQMQHSNLENEVCDANKISDVGTLEALMKLKPEKLQQIMNTCARAVLLAKLRPKQGHDKIGDDHFNDAMLKITDIYYPSEVKKLNDAKDEIMTAYNERVEQKITAMKAQLKPKKK